MVPRVVPPLSLLPRSVVLAASRIFITALSLSGLAGCVDHLMNAQVRSAEDFECKRARVRVTEVKSGIFVARGCGQEGAYRCEMGIEGGCRRLLGKPADQAMELAPEGEGESEEDTEVTTKKKKKKKPAAEEEGSGDGSKKDGSEKSGSEKSGSEKSGSEKSGSEKSGSEKSSEKGTSSKSTADKTERDEPKPEKKKKKKASEDE